MEEGAVSEETNAPNSLLPQSEVYKRPRRSLRATHWRERAGRKISEVTGDTSSTLYAITMVTIYMASKFTELSTLKIQDELEKNGFFIFLYLTGISYILYILISTVYFRRQGEFFGLANSKVVLEYRSRNVTCREFL